METTVRELLAAAQATRKAKLDTGRVDTVFKVGDRVLLRTKELLDAADIGKLRPRWPLHCDGLPQPQRRHSLAAAQDALNPDDQRGPAPSANQVVIIPDYCDYLFLGSIIPDYSRLFPIIPDYSFSSQHAIFSDFFQGY